MTGRRTYEMGPGFVRAKECPDCGHTKCGEDCVCNCDAAKAEHEAALLRERLSKAESLLRENPWVRGCLAADFDGEALQCSAEGAGVCWKHRVRAFLSRPPTPSGGPAPADQEGAKR